MLWGNINFIIHVYKALGVSRIIAFNQADYTCYRSLFLHQFRLTEYCEFLHNTTPFTKHLMTNFGWAEAILNETKGSIKLYNKINFSFINDFNDTLISRVDVDTI